jgi:hypothetical protein
MDEFEKMFRKYSADAIYDTEELKNFTKKYVGSYFEEAEK